MAREKAAPKAAPGNVILLAPDGATSATIDGTSYNIADGFVEVAQEHVSILVESYGFVASE